MVKQRGFEGENLDFELYLFYTITVEKINLISPLIK